MNTDFFIVWATSAIKDFKNVWTMNAIENLANVWAISTIEDLQYERYFGIAIEFFFFGEKENPWEKKKRKKWY